MIFVTLHVGMKDRILRFSALLLALWYCFSVIGFGVHTCKASGRSFIATFVSGLSCEDIHPEHDCASDHALVDGHDCCCHHASEKREAACCSADVHMPEYSPEDCCCSNDYHVLTITGNTIEEDDKNIVSMVMIECPVFLSMLDVPVCKDDDFYKHKYKPDSRSLYVRDILSLNSILLI